MSKSQARRKVHRQPARRESASQAERQRRPQELEKVIWIRQGTKVPGNPKFTEHAPEHHYILDVQGNRVCVCVSRVVKFEAKTTVRMDSIEKVNEVQDASGLWAAQPHVALTHVLRFLQAFCAQQQVPDDPPDRRRIRAGISPRALLMGSGMPESQAHEVLKVLKNLDLLTGRNGGETQIWFIHVGYRGIGPQFQKYTKAELIDDWALPDDDIGPQLVEETEGVDDMSDDTAGGFPSPEDSEMEADARLRMLRNFYDCALRYVPADAEIEDGFAVFTTPGPLVDLVAEKLGITESQARLASANLGHLDVLKSVMIGAGRWVRYIRPDVEITSEHVERLRAAMRNQHAVRRASELKAGGRLKYLYPAYRILLEQVPEGLEPDAEGFVEFETTNISFRDLLASRLTELSQAQAYRLFSDFGQMGVLQSRAIVIGGKPGQVRRLKVGIKRFTEEDLDKIRSVYRRAGSSTSNAVEAQAVYGYSDALELLPEALERIDAQDDQIRSLKSELEKRDETIAQLRQDKADLEAKLAKQQPGKPPAEITSAVERLRERLGKKGKD